MKRVLGVVAFLFIFSSTGLLAQDNWELKKDEDGIKVYTRKLGDEKLKEIKVVADMPGTTDQLVQVLLDVANHKNWVYGIKESRLLKQTDQSSLIYYSVADLPWPVSDRDMVLQLSVTTDPATQEATIQSKSQLDYMPHQKGKVRVPYSTASWKITPLPDKAIQAEYVFSVNPGGSLPAWVVNSVATTGPYNSFVELRKLMAAATR
ncbi:lipid-binding protein [Pontibacter qinzhouensis]|uniref:Lipid-binding protein n=1 Tax=Pontibacter qinzhouensis TaxID=2603253 RepID=A0A5C8K3Q0_9BACT|nr:START domain-containing protein [Pontibacter qinzhouensis]TXK44880.1 lipid-binding protein [Pontibacter qinzhouensis]